MTVLEKQHGQWSQVDVSVPESLVETVGSALYEEFDAGIEEVNQQCTGQLEGNETVLRIFLQKDCEPDELKERIVTLIKPWHEGFSANFIEIKTIPNQDWNSNWKQHFKPIKVGSRFIITPSWEQVHEADERIILIIDPGQAFGTGTHATTQMVLSVLERLWGENKKNGVSLQRVLDLGAGTGILGIAAVKLGAKDVLCADIDPLAVEACLQNAALNAVKLDVLEGSIDKASGDFDLILANLDKPTFFLLADGITKKVNAGAKLILSGILVEQVDQVVEELSRRHLKAIEIIHDHTKEWACMVIQSKLY